MRDECLYVFKIGQQDMFITKYFCVYTAVILGTIITTQSYFNAKGNVINLALSIRKVCNMGEVNMKRRIIEIVSGKRKTKLAVQIADTQRKREQGLKFVRLLPENEGMLFVFLEKTAAGFWMMDTYIPLSIAFVDTNGEILRILDMFPCTRYPCPIYNPGVYYQYAVEVNLGWFQRNGIKVGDYVRF